MSKLQSFQKFTWLHEELLSEGVPGKIMDKYVQFLGGRDGGTGYTSGAPYAIQSLHMQLMTVWYCLEFHWAKNRPWKPTEKGKNVMERVMKDLKQKSDMFGGFRQAHINDAEKHCAEVWDSLFDSKENKKRWGAEKARLGWQQNSGIFGLDKVKNPYGDIGNPLQGDGVYLKMMMHKKMIVKAKPGEIAL